MPGRSPGAATEQATLRRTATVCEDRRLAAADAHRHVAEAIILPDLGVLVVRRRVARRLIRGASPPGVVSVLLPLNEPMPTRSNWR